MKKENGRLDRLIDGAGWGLFIILVGLLFLAQDQGWIKTEGWSYFAIGLGAILMVGGLVRLLTGHKSGSGGLVIGLSLVYVGIAFLYGFGDWWALALIPVGIGLVVKALRGHNSSSLGNPDTSN